MAQQIINTGAVANDGTGDPLRTAFTETNSNFTEIYTAGPVGSNVRIANNTILTINTNGNLVLAPNGVGVVQSNVNIVPNQANVRNLGSSTARWGTVYAKYVDITNGTIYSGDLTVTGNLSAATVTTPELTVNMIRSDDSTVVNIQDGVEVDGDVLVNGNVTADYVLGDGSQLTGIVSSYGNPNVATFLAAYGSNTIVTTGNITTGNVLTGGVVSAAGNVRGANFNTVGLISATGNITGNYFVGNGSQLTGLSTSSISNGTSNVLIATANGNVIINTAGTYAWTFDDTGNLTIPNDIVSNTTIDIDNRASGNSADIQLFAADDITLQARDRSAGSTSEGGDINIFAGDSAEDGDSSGGDIQILAGGGGAANVDFGGPGGFITIQSGQGGAAIGNSGYSAESGGALTLNAGDAGSNNGNIDLGADGGNVYIGAGDSTGNGVNGGTIYLTSGAADASALAGDVVIQAGGTWTFDGNGNLTLPTGGQIIVSGGLISSGASPAPSINGFGSINSITVSASGNITGNYILGNGSQLTGLPATYGNANVTTLLGNLGSNNISTTGNVTASNFVGNGAALTGVAVRTTGTWTVATGTNTYSITVPINGTYQMWVRGNIPNGILVYQATLSVTNTNVPVLGTQRAWNYVAAGSPISLTTMPTQVVGVEDTISTATVATTTANVFDFVISNTSGSPQTIFWGYITL